MCAGTDGTITRSRSHPSAVRGREIMGKREIDKLVRFIQHNAGGVRQPEDRTFPFTMKAIFRPPEFMQVAFIMIHGGGEYLEFQGMTVEALVKLADQEGFSTHPRLTRIEIADSGGSIMRHKNHPRESWMKA
jgi:hypothetical protein